MSVHLLLCSHFQRRVPGNRSSHVSIIEGSVIMLIRSDSMMLAYVNRPCLQIQVTIIPHNTLCLFNTALHNTTYFAPFVIASSQWLKIYFIPGLGELQLVLKQRVNKNFFSKYKHKKTCTESLSLIIFYSCLRLWAVWGWGKLKPLQITQRQNIFFASV